MSKSQTLFILIFALIGCKDDSSTNTDPGNGSSPKNMLQTSGCTVTKVRGQVTVNCADGSASVMNLPASPFYPIDATNTGYTNLLYIDTYSTYFRFYNTQTGNIVSYSGETGLIVDYTQIYFGGPNCTGTIYGNTHFGFLGNQIVKNSTNWNAEAWKVGLYGTATVESYWTNGTCSNQTITSGFAVLTATNLDTAAPVNFTMPIKLGLAQ